MTWTMTQDLGAFEAAAGGFLRARPVAHTVPPSVAASLGRLGADAYGDGAPWCGSWRGADGAVAGASLWTPPRAVLLSPMPDDAAAALAAALTRERCAVPGVNAVRAPAEAFAAAWRRRHGGTVATAARHRLHRLGELTPPTPAPPGAARVATVADRALLLAWFTAFAEETGASPPRHARAVDDRIVYGRCTLWETGGRPVSLAGVIPTVSGATRIAPVYTPPELRGRGYAGAVTAAVSAASWHSGATELLLFTDLANPTSNALYQRLGYRPVGDHLVLEFRDA
ncbi:GNAT family N-acetyltransferase [Streptomyces celluloflavus]|uniref:GNAT family N-acetyltransferase n=1 Tax=Streptomyces celluloflavus TaxID=58344 RepID=A0ABW7R9H8_9ACTN